VSAIAEETGLLVTTIEKDYALGWFLFGIAEHRDLRSWIFKGGTCLKKCFFETYRFSEDLDFTVPEGVPYTAPDITQALREVSAWVLDATGIEAPEDGVTIEQITNKRGQTTFQARVTFTGPLQLPRAQRQRIKFDLTRDERIVDAPEPREVHHVYSDGPRPAPRVRCYSLSEIVAEKMRALYEREGRARDVFDVVNIGRNFRSDIQPDRVRAVAGSKFAFKSLPEPTPELILPRIDAATLATDWNQALRHQLQVLPPVEEFLSALREVLAWLLGAAAPSPLPPVPAHAEEAAVPRERYWRRAEIGLGRGLQVQTREVVGSRMERLRFAARNRLLARVRYQDVERLVEPYSLRMPQTGNLLLYVFEVQRGRGPGGGIKAFKVSEIGQVDVTGQPFQARYAVEL
jgi:predicted nucleotidyltransferase component of viral defense system